MKVKQLLRVLLEGTQRNESTQIVRLAYSQVAADVLQKMEGARS